MLVGFTKPTHGEASVEGFSILSDMARVYTLMGVCPRGIFEEEEEEEEEEI